NTLKYLIELFLGMLTINLQQRLLWPKDRVPKYCSLQANHSLSQKRTPGSLRVPGALGKLCLNPGFWPGGRGIGGWGLPLGRPCVLPSRSSLAIDASYTLAHAAF